MKRLALLLLATLALGACNDRGLPAAIDDPTTAVLVATVDPVEPDALPVRVNLATAATIQLLVPNTTLVPTSAVAANGAYTDAEDHTINPDCPIHFQDVDGDGDLDLILHFDVAALFPYAPDAIPATPVTVTLNVTFVDASTYTADYLVQLVYQAPKGRHYQGRP
jgi:hypothetical protein